MKNSIIRAFSKETDVTEAEKNFKIQKIEKMEHRITSKGPRCCLLQFFVFIGPPCDEFLSDTSMLRLLRGLFPLEERFRTKTSLGPKLTILSSKYFAVTVCELGRWFLLKWEQN